MVTEKGGGEGRRGGIGGEMEASIIRGSAGFMGGVRGVARMARRVCLGMMWGERKWEGRVFREGI
jgi:hypothetical protein